MTIIITGATSGLGRALSSLFLADGWSVGAIGRNAEALDSLRQAWPEGRVIPLRLDITAPDASERLEAFMASLPDLQIYLHCSGILPDESTLSDDAISRLCLTNAEGFARMTGTAYRHFARLKRPAQIAAISSIAGVRGLGDLPVYSATKAFDSTLLEALRQRADAEHLPLHITDIRPGWTRTPLLNADRHYLLEMDADRVAHLIYRAILRHPRRATIGLRWRLLTLLERHLPAPIWERLHLPLWRTPSNPKTPTP